MAVKILKNFPGYSFPRNDHREGEPSNFDVEWEVAMNPMISLTFGPNID